METRRAAMEHLCHFSGGYPTDSFRTAAYPKNAVEIYNNSERSQADFLEERRPEECESLSRLRYV